MPNRIAIVYHTSDGHTAEVADRIAARLRGQGDTVDVAPDAKAPGTLSGYDGVVLGGSVRMGKQDQHLRDYIKKHIGELQTLPGAFFSVSMAAVTDDPPHREQAAEPVAALVSETGWHPEVVAYVGGELAYTRYGFITRMVMKRIARGEGRPTDTSRDYDFTDWDAVDAFADDVHALIETHRPAVAQA